VRRAASILALAVACSGALGFVAGFDLTAVMTSGIFSVALAASGIAALFGRDLIYLAAAWGLYLGMNLAAYVDVIHAFSRRSADASAFGDILLSALLVVGVVGMLLTLYAQAKERRT
jgi:hypothetical protein